MKETGKKPIHAKIILLGDSGVGKTSILRRWAYDYWTEDDKKDEKAKNLKLDEIKQTMETNNKTIELIVHDTAGQERFRTLTASFYRNTAVVVLVFDLTNKKSYEHSADWLTDVQRYSTKSVSGVLVGNKKDLVEKRQVEHEIAELSLIHISEPTRPY
eukprot:TRINITY_DN7690_c0_g1_i1.p1 TRINITY_DN7690_c0_g1~~TRINITY_DN7690_c0_g1_i1.p1  ORF type:complete len:158 (-),score=25.85 TRINITY_DN7690_c0_g1_i1:13-486(-)